MAIKNGDLPAMPICYDARMMAAYSRGESLGMTKREMFAIAALQGLASESGRYESPSDMAHDAVKLADALIEELERTK